MQCFFRACFFHYSLKFIMFSISQIFKHFSFSSVNSAAAEFQFFYMLYSYCIIMQSWDIEANPGPGGWRSSLSVCHWNLNSIWVEDFSKLSQISAFLNMHQFDILSYRNFFRLFDFVGGSKTSSWRVQTFLLWPSF